METVAALNPKGDGDSKASEVRDFCLGNHLILTRILEHCSNSELLELSLVNKQWNFEARCVLRDRGSLTATMSNIDYPYPCLNLTDFASDLQQMSVVPFSGIHIRLSPASHYYCPPPSARRSLDLSYNVILERLPWKHLSVVVDDGWQKFRGCPAALLLKKIFKNCSGVLEELSVVLDKNPMRFYHKLVGVRKFPCLKTLKIKASDGIPYLLNLTSLIRALVSCAPNLEELHTGDKNCFQGNVLLGSSAVIVPSFTLNPIYDQVAEILISSLRPKSINIFLNSIDFKEGLLRRVVPMLLEASQKSLKCFRMDILFSVPLMCYGLRFENVTKLEIRVGENNSPGRLDPTILALLKSFDFTGIFPKLNKVKIVSACDFSFPPHKINSFVAQANAVLQNTAPGRAMDIEHLKLDQPISYSTIVFLAQMFPNVKTLNVDLQYFPIEFPFQLVFKHFMNVKKLDVEVDYCSPFLSPNLDSASSKIFEETAEEELRRNRDAYLRALSVLPVKPSIRSKHGLKVFTLDYDLDNLKGMYDEHLLVSQVPGSICALARSVRDNRSYAFNLLRGPTDTWCCLTLPLVDKPIIPV